LSEQAPISIPFNRATLAGDELRYVTEAMQSGLVAGDHSFTGRCRALLEREVGVARALLTTSCTHALEMSAILLDIKPGDEVILPSFTFVSTANAFVLRGARPVFADVRPDTLNLDEQSLDALITPRTRAIVPVHYAGVGCEMETIVAAAKRRGVAVVEDNAHGLFGRYKGQSLGTFGALATQSFHETKNVTCGEGGALLINDESLIERAEIVREKGTNRARFFRGQVDKYTWVDIGSSYLLSDVLAAYLLGQLERYAELQRERRRVWEFYDTRLADWRRQTGARGPVIPAHCEQAFHMYYVLCPSLDFRTRLIKHLRERGILAVFHYLPLHLSDVGRGFGGTVGQCPVTEDVSDRLLRLPFYASLGSSDLSRVAEAVQSFG
jgi:dTDP-4-amino-4,6-dideoxygalactose transaminase